MECLLFLSTQASDDDDDDSFYSVNKVATLFGRGGLRLNGGPTSKASNRRVTPEIDYYYLDVAIPKMTVLDEQLWQLEVS